MLSLISTALVPWVVQRIQTTWVATVYAVIAINPCRLIRPLFLPTAHLLRCHGNENWTLLARNLISCRIAQLGDSSAKLGVFSQPTNVMAAVDIIDIGLHLLVAMTTQVREFRTKRFTFKLLFAANDVRWITWIRLIARLRQQSFYTVENRYSVFQNFMLTQAYFIYFCILCTFKNMSDYWI